MTYAVEIFDTLALLRPYDIDTPKIRIGRDRDGGYILADRLDLSRRVISAGIGRETSFDEQMAARGFFIDQYDHTIAAPPVKLDKARFHRSAVGPHTHVENNVVGLADIIAQSGAGTNEMILKMDIENAEWDIFSVIEPRTLDVFSQITMEIHRLERLNDKSHRERVFKSLTTLNQSFTLFHVHANNCSKLTRCQSFVVPECLEVSYVKTDLVRRASSRTAFPTEIDRPNDPKKPEYYLWMFPFAPLHDNLLEMRRTTLR